MVSMVSDVLLMVPWRSSMVPYKVSESVWKAEINRSTRESGGSTIWERNGRYVYYFRDRGRTYRIRPTLLDFSGFFLSSPSPRPAALPIRKERWQRVFYWCDTPPRPAARIDADGPELSTGNSMEGPSHLATQRPRETGGAGNVLFDSWIWKMFCDVRSCRMSWCCCSQPANYIVI